MFDEVGKKIKTLVIALSVISMLVYVFIGLIFIFAFAKTELSTFFTVIGFAVMIIGILITYVSSFALYGYGELIDSNQQILEILEKQYNKNSSEQMPEISDTEVNAL